MLKAGFQKSDEIFEKLSQIRPDTNHAKVKNMVAKMESKCEPEIIKVRKLLNKLVSPNQCKKKVSKQKAT